MKYLIIIIATLFFSFTQKESIDSTTIKGHVNVTIDTLFLNTTLGDKLIAKIPTKEGRFNFSFFIDEPQYASLSDGKSERDKGLILLLLHPGEVTVITQDSIGADFSSNSQADFLLNELGKSINNWFATELSKLQTSSEVKSGINNWAIQRKRRVDSLKSELTSFEYRFLSSQIKNRVLSFLFFYGRIWKKIPSQDKFYDFVNDIDAEKNINKHSRLNVLYKLEIEYNREKGEIGSLDGFFSYIGESIKNKRLRSYYQAVYIRQLLAKPSYWPQHSIFVNANSLKDLESSFKERYPGSEYSEIYEDYIKTYYKILKGEEAPDFWAINYKGDSVKLSNLKGKVILIDVWATWCGPCLDERPAMMKLIDKYKEEEDFIPLMLSTNKTKEEWEKFILKEDVSYIENNLLLVGGGKISFEKNYSITYIPRYILIDKSGKFISSKIDDLESQSLMSVIDSALEE